MKKIGVFGGAFNPPTKAHAKIMSICANEFDEVWVVPSYSHAFGKDMADFEIRLELLKLQLENIEEKNIKIKDIEKTFNKKIVYTYDLLKKLNETYKDIEFVFICGEDNAKKENWEKFYKHEEIDKMCKKKVIKEIENIRSTYVRNLIKDKNENKLDQLIYKNVKDYILKNKMY